MYNSLGPVRELLSLIAIAPLAAAQWLNYPAANIPRLPDGKVDLAAPTPKSKDGKPDLSGLWEAAAPNPGNAAAAGSAPADAQFRDIALRIQGGLPFQPWAAELVKQRRADENKDDPDGYCQPLGLVKMHLHPYPRKIVQIPGLMLILFERDTQYRQIFTDGRALPEDPMPNYNGYSTANWEGDTLVVQSNGFKDGLWLDISGTPLTAAAKITERYRRPSFGRLEIDITIDDPKAYTKPWSIRVNQTFAADTDMLEFSCQENEKDAPHLVGK
jgi:hypothetical protein